MLLSCCHCQRAVLMAEHITFEWSRSN